MNSVQKYANENGLKLFESSAVTGKNIQEMFQFIATKLATNMTEENDEYYSFDQHPSFKVSQKSSNKLKIEDNKRCC